MNVTPTKDDLFGLANYVSRIGLEISTRVYSDGETWKLAQRDAVAKQLRHAAALIEKVDVKTAVSPDLIAQIAQLVSESGVKAFAEHPGVVYVPMPDDHGFWAGTANGDWDLQLVENGKSMVIATWKLGIAPEETNPRVIANAILKHLPNGR